MWRAPCSGARCCSASAQRRQCAKTDTSPGAHAPLGREPADGEHEAPQVLRRVEAAPVADPRTIGEGCHHHVAFPDAECVERARVGVVEAVPVLPRVEEGERAPRRRRRQVHARDLGERDGQHVAPRRPRRLVLLQLVLGREGQLAKIIEASDPCGRDTRGLELAPVERTVRGRVAHLLAQLRGLPARHGGARPPLDLGLQITGGHDRCQAVLVCATAAPRVEEDPGCVKARGNSVGHKRYGRARELMIWYQQ